MVGIFFEDINYGLDGGLNAQLIENRHFEMVKADTAGFGQFSTEYDGLYGWKVLDAELSISPSNPVSEANPHYLVLKTRKADCGFTNKAYDGIYLKKGMTYNISFCAKSNECKDVTVCVIKEGKTVAAETVSVDSKDWKEYSLILKADEDVEKGTFTVIVKQAGTVCFDFFSMIPEDAVMGIFRADLANLLKDLKPEFLRFPGGCIVEGSTLENRYLWKRTVGPVKDRPFNWSRWAVHTSWLEPEVGPYHYYGQTYEVGFYEYFLLCEYLGCKPVPVVGVGLACQFQTFEKVDIDDPVLEDYLQVALDLMEFANGSLDSKWG